MNFRIHLLPFSLIAITGLALKAPAIEVTSNSLESRQHQVMNFNLNRNKTATNDEATIDRAIGFLSNNILPKSSTPMVDTMPAIIAILVKTGKIKTRKLLVANCLDTHSLV